jgi:hypothetical protein
MQRPLRRPGNDGAASLAQVVELRDDDRPRWPAKAYENSKLRHHYVDDVCIAYVHPQVAEELMMMAKEKSVRHLYAGDLLCDAIGPLLRPRRGCREQR